MKTKQFFANVIPVWVIITLALWIIIKLILPEWPKENHGYQYWYFVILNIGIYGTSLYKYWFSVEVEVNTSQVLQNRITGSLHPKWPGFEWKSIFDYLKYTIDTQKHLSTKDSGDCSAKDDMMRYSWKVLWRVNTKCNRDENMKKYVQTTEANIESAIKLFVNGLITDFCYTRLSDNVKRDRKLILIKDKFIDICEEYGIEIVDCGVEDMDYSEETEKARADERQMKAFQKAVDALMDLNNPNHCSSLVEAEKIVKAKMLGGNYKQIEITNPTGTPVVVNP